MNFHTISSAESLRDLKTDEKKGLSASQARKRLEHDGKNQLEESPRKSLMRRFFEQFSDFMVIILLIASVISFATSYFEENGDLADPIIILMIVILNAIIGVVQESRAQRAIDALRRLCAPHAKVIRDGKPVTIKAENIVVGDILVLSTGDSVPADARLLTAVDLKTEESALTGESLPVEKNASYIARDHAPVGDMKNMIFSTTKILSGHCTAVVTATGMNTQVGHIANMLNSEDTPQTQLQIRLKKVGQVLGTGAVLICAIIFVMGILRRENLLNSFMLSVSLAVAAIPEGLPAVVTIVLSIGVQRMSKSNAIIRRLPAVETLGSATVICSDKTGTLTQNLITVTAVYSPEGKESLDSVKAQRILTLGALCNNSRITGKKGHWTAHGDPTENAIVYAAAEQGNLKDGLDEEFPRVGEIPFSSERKLMTTIHKTNRGYRVITKGAPDVLIPRCSDYAHGESKSPLNTMKRQRIESQNITMAEHSLRVIGVAYKDILNLNEATEEDLIFCGLIGMMDPPRKDARKAVQTCKTAGIIPVMITGDHIVTAKAIARDLDILDENGEAMTGTQLDKIPQEELCKKIENYRVFARVSPEHKVRIVKAFQSRGEVVAMTGDGVNDAPALKAADIGCAMGKSGTDVAKDAADMILTDDNFSTVVKAVEQGRGIYLNIKKAVHFLLSCNIGEILVIFVASLMGLPTPLLPIHLLWINLVTDSLPAMALGVEPVDKEIMKEPPIPPKQSLFANGLWLDIAIEGMLVGALSLFAFIIGHTFFDAGDSTLIGRTMSFAVLSISELIHAFNMRSSHSLFKIGIFSNKKMVSAFIICLLLQLSVITITPLAVIFKTCTLNSLQWLIVVGLSLVMLVAMEIGKLTTRAKHKSI